MPGIFGGTWELNFYKMTPRNEINRQRIFDFIILMMCDVACWYVRNYVTFMHPTLYDTSLILWFNIFISNTLWSINLKQTYCNILNCWIILLYKLLWRTNTDYIQCFCNAINVQLFWLFMCLTFQDNNCDRLLEAKINLITFFYKQCITFILKFLW